MKARRARPFRVLVDMNLASFTAREQLRGIFRFARDRRDWVLSVAMGRKDGDALFGLGNTTADGILSTRRVRWA